jgi:hypothetical protein
MASFGGPMQPRTLLYNLKSMHGIQRKIVQMPAGAYVEEMELSPNGKRFAWLLDFGAVGTDPSLRRLPFIPDSPGAGYNQVWVSNLDGSGMHILATPGTDIGRQGPNNLRWTPDSLNVTFTYDRNLYTVPADPPVHDGDNS